MSGARKINLDAIIDGQPTELDAYATEVKLPTGAFYTVVRFSSDQPLSSGDSFTITTETTTSND